VDNKTFLRITEGKIGEPIFVGTNDPLIERMRAVAFDAVDFLGDKHDCEEAVERRKVMVIYQGKANEMVAWQTATMLLKMSHPATVGTLDMGEMGFHEKSEQFVDWWDESHGMGRYEGGHDFIRVALERTQWLDPATLIGEREDDIVDPIGDVDKAAFYGILGKLALETQPETEANPLFVLMHLMVFAGANIGRYPYFVLGPDKHRMLLNVATVAPSGVGRKGSASNVAKELWLKIDANFHKENIADGLNSGKGLLTALRDGTRSRSSKEPDDPGVIDKRKVFLESEFSAVFKQGHRESDPLLDYLRKLWDGEETISSLTKDPMRVTGAHVGIILHSTPGDISVHLTSLDKSNGTANRVIYLFGVRSKRLKRGGNVFALLDTLGGEIGRASTAIGLAKKVGFMRRTARAEKLWTESLYDRLDDVPSGNLGALFVRASSHVLRMASIFALMDLEEESDVDGIAIDIPHITAALAIWDHSVRSLRYLFHGDSDPEADKLLLALKDTKEGLTRSQISSEVFGRNRQIESINGLLTRLLVHRSIVRIEPKSNGRGRPAVRYKINGWH
jgi:hypothetical protein